MLIQERVLDTLEYNKILDMLVQSCPTEGARAKARTLLPLSDLYLVEQLQQQTEDARRLMDVKGLPSFGAGRDVTDACERADKGAQLTPGELLDIASLLQAVHGLSEYGKLNRTFETVLDERFNMLIPMDSLATRITKAILSEDRIADDASPALAEIRRKKRSINLHIKEILQHYTSGSHASSYLQEAIVTTRNGRFVIPVKAEHKNDIRGLIHDTSSSGATVFMEPMAVVEANNELSEMDAKERHEIDKILMAFSQDVSNSGTAIVLDYRTLTDLSFIFGRAILGQQMNAVRPVFGKTRSVDLKQARHPLIDRDRVVPIDLRLGEDSAFDTLVITGPNTGGKTVSLKTLGLLCLMAQAGLQIPAKPESRLTLFDSVLVDIGDEQSIQQSLSTFSSHMVRIIDILNHTGDQSLVILDELGAGTDPVEGAALAQSILEHVRKKGALCAVTTHYAELKAYALNTPGVCNASCEFDVQTLKPTFRLIIGTPGKSNAFAISAKLGLDGSVIERAKELVDSDNIQFEDVIGRLDSVRQELEKQRDEAARIRAELEREEASARKKIEEDRKKAQEALTDARNKSAAMIQSAKASSEFIFKEADKVRKEKEAEAISKRTQEARKAIRERLRSGPGDYEAYDLLEQEDGGAYTLPRDLVKGDHVIIRSIGQQGVLLDGPDKDGNWKVQAGSLRTKVHTDDLRLAEDVPDDKKPQSKKEKPLVKRSLSGEAMPFELDLRGLTGYEAWLKVDKYLDTAILHGLHEVRLVHGKGTGALRTYLQGELKKDRRVAEQRLGKLGEGDTGVTVVTLKT